MIKKFHHILNAVGIDPPLGLKDPLIESICADSRLVSQGSLFFGLPGENVDGASYLNEAFSSGAVAAVISQESKHFIPPAKKDLVLVVPGLVATLMGEISSVFWNQPSLNMNLIGVTGTNGKTTTTYLIEHLCKSAGGVPALFGTLFNRWPGFSETAKHTTGFGDVLQSQLAQAVSSGVNIGAMEVSSHSLSQGRIAGCLFSGAVFTNLTQDHLDYHESMEAYFEAKTLLFEPTFLNNDRPRAIVNIDNYWGKTLAKRLGEVCWQCSLEEQTIQISRPELFITNIKTSLLGVEGILHSPLGQGLFISPLIGRFNLMNSLQAIGVLLQHGFDLEILLNSIADFTGVPGRMERVLVRDGENPINLPTVIVDYAHTPDGLKNALIASRPFTSKKLICVFGCGGDRDRGKRPAMGSIAAELADCLILTSDNPRTEDPDQILNDVLSGVTKNCEMFIERDRALAIQLAVSKANSGDMVLIAGKGHEDYQIIGKQRIQFDDREIAEQALRQKDRF